MSQPTDQGPSASAPGASLAPDSTDLFTYAHLALIAIFAVVVIVGIVVGMRLARRRRQAMREIREDNALIEPAPAPTVAADGTVAAPVTAPAAPPPAPAETPASTVPGDDPGAGPVTQLKGLGPKLATRLTELGVTTVGQLAALTDDEAAALDAQLGPFAGRLGRDRWQEQARFLAAGDRKGFESVFGRL